MCRFSRPYGDAIISERVSPKGTGYEEHLYSMHAETAPPIPDMEHNFMSLLDSDASEALSLLEGHSAQSQWDDRLRSAWSRFVWAQSIRTPSEIAQLKAAVKEEMEKSLPRLQEAYDKARPDDAPAGVNDYYSSLDPYHEDRLALSIACQSMDHSGIIDLLNNMHWAVVDFSTCGIGLLTSDRSVWMTATLVEPDAFVTMPIGPTRLFVAAREEMTLRRIMAHNRRQQAKEVNKITVMHAMRFVFAGDETARKLVQKHFATRRHSTHMERLASLQGLSILADDSPQKD